ncbi:MAG: TRAP transporter large permease subunit, partial [Pseudomonadota bacterium]
LIIVVLGIIYLGICTPTEAAGVGAFCAFIIALVRGKLTKKNFYSSMLETLSISVMIMWVVLGAKCFVHIYTASGASDFVGEIIGNLPINMWFIVILMQLIILFLGMFIDPIGILMITVPVFLPIIEGFGMDPIWFGVLLTINLEMAYITPPFGLNLFYLKSIMPSEVSMKDLYASVAFFVLGDMLTMALVMIFPQIALWLPQNMN